MSYDSAYLQHILDAIETIERYIGGGEDEFLESTLIQDGVIRNLEIIGEAVKLVSKPLKMANPEIPWSRIAGMRDKLIHQYFGVKLDVVWETAHRILPAFKLSIQNIIDTE